MTQPRDKIVMQVTVTAEQDPELFAALLHIQEPKRRANRLKALCLGGFLARNGSGPVTGNAADHHPSVTDTPSQRPIIPALLAWDEE